MMIARPDNYKSLIVFKHPDQNFPMYSQLTVDSDECAVFFKNDVCVAVCAGGKTRDHASVFEEHRALVAVDGELRVHRKF